MTKLREAWAWFKEWAWAISLGLVAILGAGIVWDSSRRRTAKIADELAVERAKNKVAALDARREALNEADAAHVEEITAIQTERAAVAREIVALDNDVSAMSDEEVERAFRDLY